MFPDRTYYRFCFLAHVTAVEENPQLDTDIVGVVWMNLDELQESARARSPLVLKAVEDALAGKKYPVSLIYEHPFSPSFTSHLDA
jgi:hypothetical protein